MKLTDLRDELTTRANTTDETPDLLAGVHRKITQTKRRRMVGAAGIAGGVAAIAAFAFVLPSLTTSTPAPASDVPRDYVKDGMVLHGLEGKDQLEKGWIGDKGQGTLAFSWTPKAQATRFVNYCVNDRGIPRYATVTINDYLVGTNDCGTDQDSLGGGTSVLADNALWLVAPAGKPARVVVQLTDGNGRSVQDPGTQVALGIYRTAFEPVPAPPTQAPPTSPDDYVKDGIRYRAKIGGDTLLAAGIADRGKNSVEFSFTATGGPISVTDFCTASSPGPEAQYQTSISFNGQQVSSGSCTGASTDAGVGTSFIPGQSPPAGQRVTVSVRLEDKAGKPITKPNDWIGLGIYAKGKQRVVGDTFLDEVREYNGRNYRLADLKTAEARTARQLELATPADKPYLVSYGSSTLAGDAAQVSVTGLSTGTNNTAGGIGTAGEGPRPAGTVKLELSAGKFTAGVLVLALYLPAD
ncbi:hypothetical protein AB0P21_16360 [Kribbella sp. NPDC056861]|uniref:hypothetical protein n=1 Tax=Kribbella sp. NPDC056861 TaxID=3154857 RepID=UPI00343D4AD8